MSDRPRAVNPTAANERRRSARQSKLVAVGDGDPWAQLCTLLWGERGLLEHLLFKLTEEQFIICSGSTRWLNQADEEVRSAVATVQDTDVMRAVEVGALTRRIGDNAEITLRELAEVAPEPWGLLLSDHRSALRALAVEIETTATENRGLLHACAEETRETLDRVSSVLATYEAPVETVARGGPAAYLLDQQA